MPVNNVDTQSQDDLPKTITLPSGTYQQEVRWVPIKTDQSPTLSSIEADNTIPFISDQKPAIVVQNADSGNSEMRSTLSFDPKKNEARRKTVQIESTQKKEINFNVDLIPNDVSR